jgi:heme-degrading monooxygenase HmoA
MITRLVKLSLQAAKADEFEALFYQTQAMIEDSEGCHKTDLFKVSGNESEYFTISYWNTEKDLENYRASNLFKSVWAQVKPLFSAKAEAWTLSGVIPVSILTAVPVPTEKHP